MCKSLENHFFLAETNKQCLYATVSQLGVKRYSEISAQYGTNVQQSIIIKI